MAALFRDKEDDRHVAILLASPILQWSVLPRIGRLTRFLLGCDVYQRKHVDRLARAVLDRRVKGVVVVRLKREPTTEGIEALLRLRMQELAGGATELLLREHVPPISGWHFESVVRIVQTIMAYARGSRTIPEEGPFHLGSVLEAWVSSGLLSEPSVPGNGPEDSVVVTLVDDRLDEIAGLVAMLDAWPGIDTRVTWVRNGDMPEIPEDTDILLTDALLGPQMWDWKFVSHLHAEDRLPAVVGSIGKQNNGDFQTMAVRVGREVTAFTRKMTVTTSEKDARAFVAFMCGLLDRFVATVQTDEA